MSAAKDKWIENCILLYGMALRFIYVLFSSIYDRQYDIGAISLDAGHTVSGGHLAYVQTLYENIRLPDVNPTTVYQFHHPPLHHYLCAAWMKCMSFLIHDNSALQESMQAVPFVCSIVILIFSYKILRQFDAEGISLWTALTVLAVHPALIRLSGSVNNDCTALAFSVLTIYFMVRWLKDMSFKNILFTAIFLGAGISTKQNVAELAFPIGICFLIVLVLMVQKRDCPVSKENGEQKSCVGIKKLLVQYAAFGAVSIPLGMWFYIRNLVRYGMSILWVYELPKDSWQYTGNVPALYRFLWPVPSELLHNLTSFRLGCGYNVWMQIARTSVLGEWDMADAGKGVKALAVLLIFAGAVLSCCAAICFVRVFAIGWRKDGTRAGALSKVFFLTGYIVTMLFYLGFVYRYPYECSMDFRYIAVTLPFMAAGIGADKALFHNKTVRIIYFVVLAGFALFSTCMIGVWIAG